QRSEDNVVNIADRRKTNIQNVLGKLQESAQLADDDESDGRIVYSCRLGDTLRSIALRHPALKDVSLWKLIAQINKLSTEVDEKGHPLVALTRNMKLKLPSAQEIHDFKTRPRKRTTQAHVIPTVAEPAPSLPLTPPVPSVPPVSMEVADGDEMIRPDDE